MKAADKYLLAVCMFSTLFVGVNAQDTVKEEVVFKSGENVLSGTLVLPDSAESVPVILFMGGMYEWGDFHPQREVFIEENLEAVFPRSGVGVFYYDPRGVGDSDGRWGRATLNDFADDALAAISYLKQRKEVDPERIGIIGHGEDGWVAQIVAATAPDEVKFMVSLAGPTFDPTKQLINEYHSEYVCNGEDSTAAYDRAAQKAQSHQNWVSMISITKRWRHMKMKLEYDSAEYLREITIPALFIFGENDGQVYPSWAMEELNTVFQDSIPPNFSTFSIPGANHYFHVVSPCYKYEDESESIRKNFSFRFNEVFRSWVFGQL